MNPFLYPGVKAYQPETVLGCFRNPSWIAIGEIGWQGSGNR
jgi:hypothetical protein